MSKQFTDEQDAVFDDFSQEEFSDESINISCDNGRENEAACSSGATQIAD